MLTQAGRDYIATNLGINNCWVSSGLTWEAHSQQGEIAHMSGGTVFIMSNITSPETSHITLKTPRTGEFTLAMIVSNNGGNTITDADIAEIRENDGNPAGEAQYCAGGTTPTPAPGTPTPTPGPVEGYGTISCEAPDHSNLYLNGTWVHLQNFPPERQDPSNINNWHIIEVPVPGTYVVKATLDGCNDHSEEIRFRTGQSGYDKTFQATTTNMDCSYAYPGFYSVKAYSAETGEPIGAVAKIGDTSNFCQTSSTPGDPGCTLQVDAKTSGGVVEKTINVTSQGYDAYGPTNSGVKHTAKHGDLNPTLVEAWLEKGAARYIVITEGQSFISKWGISAVQQWVVGTTLEPHVSYSKTWAQVECVERATYLVHITFTDINDNTPSNTPDAMWTQAKTIRVGATGTPAKLYYPYFLTFDSDENVINQEAGSWLVKREWVGTWKMWAQLGTTELLTPVE